MSSFIDLPANCILKIIDLVPNVCEKVKLKRGKNKIKLEYSFNLNFVSPFFV